MSFLESLDKIWEDWNIRGAVLFSLMMQIILIGLAPLRKLSSNRILTIFIWCAYLLADAIATSSVGLIIKTQIYGDGVENSSEEYFLALWIPFLLLHLGGPDTITAFALEDNELCIRHLLGLATQGITIGSLLFRTFSSNKLRLPTLLLFIAGIIKYMERTCSLFLASKDAFRNSMIRKPKAGGVNLAKLGAGIDLSQNTGKTQETKSDIANGDKTTTPASVANNGPKAKNDLEVIAKAREYFKIFKGLIVDLVFSFKERDESRKFFDSITPENAFGVIEAELNFMYEVLYTKASVVHSILGSCFGLVASSSVITALVMFHFFIKKHRFDKVDIGVTYALLLGAIGLDALASLMSIFSNWTMVTVFSRSCTKDNSFLSKFYTAVLPVYKYLLDIKKPRRYVNKTDNHTTLRTHILFRKWSECVPCFNLVTYCLKGCPVRIHNRMSQPVSAHIIMSSIHREIGKLSSPINHVWRTTISSNKAIQFLSDRSKLVNYFLRVDIAVKYWIDIKKKFIKLVYLTELFEELTYVSREPLTMELWEFIFDDLKEIFVHK
ncbi:uncharacterized protein [Euphorbia lathyris]|uniref:uncharacterized protein n=1 Tax=Euphorbia lathyris TaxID=212925 RepID=UPI003313333C